MASSSYSVLLCVSIFVAVSSVGSAWVDDYFNPDDYIFPAGEEEPAAACDYVNRYFPACEDYLDGSIVFPRTACCSNLLILRGITYEVGPQKICQCIEDLKMTFVESRIKEVYEKCDVHLNFPISEHMDCSRPYRNVKLSQHADDGASWCPLRYSRHVEISLVTRTHPHVGSSSHPGSGW
nr:non-specific lipid-transfer protein 13-like [Ipomoea batatas]